MTIFFTGLMATKKKNLILQNSGDKSYIGKKLNKFLYYIRLPLRMFWKTGSVAKPDLYRVELIQDTPLISVMKGIRMSRY
jgi:hypothetical protein